MGKHSNQFNKGIAMEMLRNKHSSRQVAKRLKVNASTVCRWKKEYNLSGNVERKHGSGRKKILKRLD